MVYAFFTMEWFPINAIIGIAIIGIIIWIIIASSGKKKGNGGNGGSSPSPGNGGSSPSPPAPGAPGAPCPSTDNSECKNGACAHDGDSQNYICCKPAKDWPTESKAYKKGDYCNYTYGWCKVNNGEACEHNCQCGRGLDCTNNICS